MKNIGKSLCVYVTCIGNVRVQFKKNFFFRKFFNVNAGNLKDILVCLWVSVCVCAELFLSFLFLIYIAHVFMFGLECGGEKGSGWGRKNTHKAPKIIHFNNKTRKQCNDDDKKL